MSQYSAPQPFYSAAAPMQQTYTIIPTAAPVFIYNSSSPAYQLESKKSSYQITTKQQSLHFQPDHFLKPVKGSKFVAHAKEIQPYIEETYYRLFQEPFPEDIKISVLNKEEFRKIAPHPSTIGVSFNRRQQGLLSEIFVLNDLLPRVLLTLGHELGHVLTPTLEDPIDEEGKAYSFSFIWMETIKEHNIANLQNSIVTENPATNGLHDKAFEYIMMFKRAGSSFTEIYNNFIKNKAYF